MSASHLSAVCLDETGGAPGKDGACSALATRRCFNWVLAAAAADAHCTAAAEGLLVPPKEPREAANLARLLVYLGAAAANDEATTTSQPPPLFWLSTVLFLRSRRRPLAQLKSSVSASGGSCATLHLLAAEQATHLSLIKHVADDDEDGGGGPLRAKSLGAAAARFAQLGDGGMSLSRFIQLVYCCCAGGSCSTRFAGL